jgi:hypothetical protein
MGFEGIEVLVLMEQGVAVGDAEGRAMIRFTVLLTVMPRDRSCR